MVRSKLPKHNLNCNYNLMGFDTIEINLVLVINPLNKNKNRIFFVFEFITSSMKIIIMSHTFFEMKKYLALNISAEEIYHFGHRNIL